MIDIIIAFGLGFIMGSFTGAVLIVLAIIAKESE